MALRAIGIQRTGRMPSSEWDGGVTDFLAVSHDGYRSGQVIGGQGLPVGGILIGCIYEPTRRIVGHTRSDENGEYYFDGLRVGVSDYFFFAYPDAKKLNGDYDFATRYKIIP